jgi:hypothetical protein
MQIFTEPELKLIGKLKEGPSQRVLQIAKPCPIHSVCTPLPLFRIYKIDDLSFEAQWNGYHEPFTKQIFQFADAD